MSGHTKKHPINQEATIILKKDRSHHYDHVPNNIWIGVMNILKPYEKNKLIDDTDDDDDDALADVSWDELFAANLEAIGGIKEYRSGASALRGYRYREDLKQDELAKLLGTKQSYISALENAKEPIGKAMAKKLAEIFKTNYRFFL